MQKFNDKIILNQIINLPLTFWKNNIRTTSNRKPDKCSNDVRMLKTLNMSRAL